MIVIIMAGGLGKRMESDLPKVLHKVNLPNVINTSYPMIVHVILKALTITNCINLKCKFCRNM